MMMFLKTVDCTVVHGNAVNCYNDWCNDVDDLNDLNGPLRENIDLYFVFGSRPPFRHWEINELEFLVILLTNFSYPLRRVS